MRNYDCDRNHYRCRKSSKLTFHNKRVDEKLFSFSANTDFLNNCFRHNNFDLFEKFF